MRPQKVAFYHHYPVDGTQPVKIQLGVGPQGEYQSEYSVDSWHDVTIRFVVEHQSYLTADLIDWRPLGKNKRTPLFTARKKPMSLPLPNGLFLNPRGSARETMLCIDRMVDRFGLPPSCYRVEYVNHLPCARPQYARPHKQKSEDSIYRFKGLNDTWD